MPHAHTMLLDELGIETESCYVLANLLVMLHITAPVCVSLPPRFARCVACGKYRACDE